MLSDTMFEQFLEILKANYDYVIVDTPPINAVIDGAIVAKSCDGTVMVLEQGVTERAEAIRRHSQKHMKINTAIHQFSLQQMHMMQFTLSKLQQRKLM